MRYFKRGRYRYLIVLVLCSFCMWSFLSSSQSSSVKELMPDLDHVNITDAVNANLRKDESLADLKVVDGDLESDGAPIMEKALRLVDQAAWSIRNNDTDDSLTTINTTTLDLKFTQPEIDPGKPAKDEVVWKDAIHLAGDITRQGVLTIGIPTVMRPNASYLQTTLKSLIDNMSVQEREQVVCVVFLSGDNATFAAHLARNLTLTFPKYIEDGFIRLISAPREYYPSLEGLKRTYNDKVARVKWRSKQNLDYAFLIHYSQNISKYYLQIEDDVLAGQDFFGKIMLFIKKQTKQWAMLDFSGKGFIGKLFKSADLPKLAHLLRLFFNEQPCDFLINYFSSLLTQPKAIVRKPSLFKHIGYYSSLKDQIRKVEDTTFTNNPDARLNTTIETYKKFYLSNVYHYNTKFWGKTPNAGDTVDITFDKVQKKIKRIIIQTGETKKPSQDRVKGAILEAGKEPVNQSGIGCRSYVYLAKFKDGHVDYNSGGLTNIRCLRMTITEVQEDWLVIRKVQIIR